jgi:hypothetical protein
VSSTLKINFDPTVKLHNLFDCVNTRFDNLLNFRACRDRIQDSLLDKRFGLGGLGLQSRQQKLRRLDGPFDCMDIRYGLLSLPDEVRNLLLNHLKRRQGLGWGLGCYLTRRANF